MSKSEIVVGSQAPDFTLPNQDGNDISLSQYLGKTVVLVFYPADDSLVCTKQLCSYNNELTQFTDLNAQVVAISQQDVDHHQKFSSKHNFKFPLLADTKKVVLAAYGVLGFLNLPRRSVFVISPNGIVSYLHRAVVGVSYRPVAELVEAIADAQAGTH